MQHGRGFARGVWEVFGGHRLCGVFPPRASVSRDRLRPSTLFRDPLGKTGADATIAELPGFGFPIGRHATLKKGGPSYNLIK